MEVINDTKVVIGGKVITIRGAASEEYMQRVATYLNNKIEKLEEKDFFKKVPSEMQNVLVQINIVDDLFEARKHINMLEEDVNSKEKDIYDLKHELVAAKMRLDKIDKTLKALQEKNAENEKEIIRLETELKNRSGGRGGMNHNNSSRPGNGGQNPGNSGQGTSQNGNNPQNRPGGPQNRPGMPAGQGGGQNPGSQQGGQGSATGGNA